MQITKKKILNKLSQEFLNKLSNETLKKNVSGNEKIQTNNIGGISKAIAIKIPIKNVGRIYQQIFG